MIQLRSHVFETNSSMTHCCVITTEYEFKDWANGKTWFCEDTEQFMDADLAFEENVKILEEKLQSKHSTFDEEMLEKYKNKEIQLVELFPNHKYKMKELYLTSDEWDDVVSDGDYEYWEERGKIATNPPTTVVAFGYIGGDY